MDTHGVHYCSVLNNPEGHLSDDEWTVLATYASGFEADLAVALLVAADIPAVRDSNDTVGIFGPGFQGATTHGVAVRVPTAALEDARAVVSRDSGR